MSVKAAKAKRAEDSLSPNLPFLTGNEVIIIIIIIIYLVILRHPTGLLMFSLYVVRCVHTFVTINRLFQSWYFL